MGGRDRDRDRRPSRFRRPRRRVCMYCVDKITHVDYKNIDQLRNFLTDRAKIQARRQSGCCAKHQRAMTRAVKRAREIALLPFVAGS